MSRFLLQCTYLFTPLAIAIASTSSYNKIMLQLSCIIQRKVKKNYEENKSTQFQFSDNGIPSVHKENEIRNKQKIRKTRKYWC